MRLDELRDWSVAVMYSPEGMGDRNNFSASYAEDLEKARNNLFLYDVICEAILAQRINYSQAGLDEFIRDFLWKYRRNHYAVSDRRHPHDSGSFYVRLDTNEKLLRLVFDLLFAYFARRDYLNPEIQFGGQFHVDELSMPISFDCFCSLICKMRDDVVEVYHFNGPIGNRVKFHSRICPRSKNEIEMEVQREHFESHKPALRAKLLAIRDHEERRLMERASLLKRLGTPYLPTFPEYLRYLRTNCQVMQTKNGDFFLLLDDILEVGVPL